MRYEIEIREKPSIISELFYTACAVGIILALVFAFA